jgi:hypothetical protein
MKKRYLTKWIGILLSTCFVVALGRGAEVRAGKIKKAAVGTISQQNDVGWGWGHYKMYEFGKKNRGRKPNQP